MSKIIRLAASHLGGLGITAQSSTPGNLYSVVAADAQLGAACHARDRLSCRNFGGAERDRTADPLVANQVLSQLSYSPTRGVKLVGLGRVELPTSPLSGVRSSQLSYRPMSSCQLSVTSCQLFFLTTDHLPLTTDSGPDASVSNHFLKMISRTKLNVLTG